MNVEAPRIGEKYVWYRVGYEEQVTVLDAQTVDGILKAKIKVEGWAHNYDWEPWTHLFVRYDDWRQQKYGGRK